MFNLENLRIETYIEMMNDGGAKYEKKANKFEERVLRLKAKFTDIKKPEHAYNLLKGINKAKTKEKRLREKAILSYDIGATINWSTLNDEWSKEDK